MNIQERFEAYWADVHDVPPESLAQYRHATKDGYRLPYMASHYRTFCAALQGLPEEQEVSAPKTESKPGLCAHGLRRNQSCFACMDILHGAKK